MEAAQGQLTEAKERKDRQSEEKRLRIGAGGEANERSQYNTESVKNWLFTAHSGCDVTVVRAALVEITPPLVEYVGSLFTEIIICLHSCFPS